MTEEQRPEASDSKLRPVLSLQRGFPWHFYLLCLTSASMLQLHSVFCAHWSLWRRGVLSPGCKDYGFGSWFGPELWAGSGCVLIGENGSRGTECFCASRRARCVRHPEFIPVAVEVLPPSLPRDWPPLGVLSQPGVSRPHAWECA